MNACAPAREPVQGGKSREFGQQIAHSHPPANAFERMLITQIEQSWERLQRAYEVEKKYFEGRDIAETIATKLAEFKAVTRYVTDSERAWRHAVLNLEKTQRRRLKEAQAIEKVRQSPKPPEPAPLPRVTNPPVVEVARPHRE